MKWLGLGISVWTLGGCLIPQEETYLNEFPEPRNRPPRIVEQQVQPPERIIRGYGSDLCEFQFSVIVEDPDLNDTLYVNWFVDYDPTQLRGADGVGRLQPNNKVVRDERASFNPKIPSIDYSRLNVPGDHVVEVVVSDTPLVGRDPERFFVKRLADGTEVYDQGYSATYAWFVRTEPGGGCP
ncbi:MAG TPA: hypothetical protein VF794_26505 [Archangium sp.]|jgi:hypothetical protein|uniref:hypothetical protein n=1 Tax=Archangium sp. TaxID=1872627 RepID=UPI002ED9D18F